MRIDTEITGIEDVNRVLGVVAPRVAKNIMRSTVHGMAGELRNGARKEAPKDDGVLRKAIKTKRRRVRNGIAQSDVIVQRSAFYWRFVEYGTVKLAENPFFKRTLERFKGQAMRSFLTQFVKKFEATMKRGRR